MIDIRECAELLISLAKENMERDGILTPVAVLVSMLQPTEIISLEFARQIDKQRAYFLVSLRARAIKADAVILINDVWYYPQDAPKDRREAVHVMATGPDFQPFSLLLPYHRVGQKIHWESSEHRQSDIAQWYTLMPWWDQEKRVESN